MYHPAATTLLALAIVVGFAPAKAEEDPLVATVDQTPIHVSDVRRRIEQLPLGDQVAVREQVGRFTDSVVREELLFQYALNHVMEVDPALRDQIKALVVDKLIESRVKEKIVVTPEHIEQYYTDNPSQVRGEHWRVRHIPLDTHADCERLLPQIEDEASFAALATQYGTDAELAADGGDMGYFMAHHDVLGLGTLVHTLPVHKPFMYDNQDGCHLIWISEHLQPPMPPLEDVAPQLRAFLEGREEALLLRGLVDDAAANVAVTRYPLETE